MENVDLCTRAPAEWWQIIAGILVALLVCVPISRGLAWLNWRIWH